MGRECLPITQKLNARAVCQRFLYGSNMNLTTFVKMLKECEYDGY